MADFQSSPSFVNPAYATPEQLAQQRAYAAELAKRAGQDVNRPTGAIASMANALTGVLERNRANEIQSQAAGQNSGDISALIAQLQKGQPIDPNVAGRVYANPMASPEHRALIGALVTPKVGEDVAGRPTTTSPAGGMQGLPVGPGIEPGIRPGMSTPDASISAVPQAAPPIPGAPRSMALPPPPAGGVRMPPPGAVQQWRNENPIPAPISGGGGQAPGAALPTAPAPAAVPNRPMTLDQLAAKGRELAAARTFTQGTAEAQTNLAKGDFDAAAAAPAIQRVAGVMLDDLRSSNNMNMGPTAETKTRFKKVLANELPGLLSKEQIEGIASQDSFEKSAAQLSSIITRGGSGTDAQLLNNIKSVPGAHNSKEGAEALLLMTMDVAKQQQALRQATAGAKTAQEYEAMRGAFFADPRNRIINPITKNPIEQDVAGQKAAGTSSGYEKTATNPQTGEKIGLRNGKWEPIK